jgi:two-component system sensor histidine kinase VicK
MGDGRGTIRPPQERPTARSSRPEVETWGRDLGRIRAVVDAVPEAVLVTERDGRLRLTNPAADRLFLNDPVVDRDDLLSRFEPVAREEAGSLPAAREGGREAVIVRQRNRPTRWFALRTVALDGADPEDIVSDDARPSATPDAGGDASVAFVLRDVTDTRDLQPVREAFLGLVSHELRTPITTIYAGSSVLARQQSLSPPATRTLARDVSFEAARLYDLVEDLLVLARIERGVLEPLDEPVDVDRVIDSTIRVATERHGTARIRVRSRSSHASVRGDATYLEQACRNIVLGLLRRPGQVADPELEIEIAEDALAGVVRVGVHDHGPAVPAGDVARVFDLPDASTGSNQAIGGLGLFVARQVTEAMGGRAWARTSNDGGLELGVELRMDDEA